MANIALTDGVSGMCSVGNISCYLKIGTAREILVNAIPAAALDPALIPLTSFSSTYRPYSLKNRCPREGRWPFTFELPTGSGYAVATLTVNYLGTCTAAGRLGDGTAFAFSAPMLDPVYGGITNIENSGTFVFHVPLYGLQGRISGTATFSASTSPHNLTGTGVWIRPAPPRGTVFLPTGIYVGMNMYGSRYTAPDPGTRIDAAFTATSGVSLFHTSLEPYADIDQSVTLTTANTFTSTAPNTHLLKLAVARASGILTGTVKFTGATALSPVTAAFIHHPTLGTGFFGYVPGKTGYGPVMLQP